MEIQSEIVITAARNILKSYGYFVDNLWHMDDINLLCEQMNYPALTLQQCHAIFDIVNEQFDGEYGISWPQLERALQTYIQHCVTPTELTPHNRAHPELTASE